MTTKRSTPRTAPSKEKRAPAKRARGPSDAHARALLVIDLYAQGGQGMRACCKKVGIARSAFDSVVAADPALQGQYARARAMADEIEFDGLAEIADEEPPLTATGQRDSAWVAWQRTRIDTRKWMLARKQPTKYGDRQQIDHNVTADTAAILTAARKRSGKPG